MSVHWWLNRNRMESSAYKCHTAENPSQNQLQTHNWEEKKKKRTNEARRAENSLLKNDFKNIQINSSHKTTMRLKLANCIAPQWCEWVEKCVDIERGKAKKAMHWDGDRVLYCIDVFVKIESIQRYHRFGGCRFLYRYEGIKNEMN